MKQKFLNFGYRNVINQRTTFATERCKWNENRDTIREKLREKYAKFEKKLSGVIDFTKMHPVFPLIFGFHENVIMFKLVTIFCEESPRVLTQNFPTFCTYNTFHLYFCSFRFIHELEYLYLIACTVYWNCCFDMINF